MPRKIAILERMNALEFGKKERKDSFPKRVFFPLITEIITCNSHQSQLRETIFLATISENIYHFGEIYSSSLRSPPATNKILISRHHSADKSKLNFQIFLPVGQSVFQRFTVRTHKGILRKFQRSFRRFGSIEITG